MEKLFSISKVEKIIDSKETSDLENCLSKLEGKFENIGEGGNAIVFFAKDTPFEKICFKKIKKNPQINYNDIDKEHEFQLKARDLGVRTPLTLLSIKTKEGDEYLVMEKINGYTVNEILKNPDLAPANFDYWIFCKDLEDQISKMHKNGKIANDGIFHRDLHDRNVMINNDGLAVIIDFGTATEGTGSDFTYEESVSVYNEKKGCYEFVNGYFKDDDKMVKNIKDSLKRFMK